MSGIAVSLCMIVRDEEQNLSRALGSVKEWVDEMVVVDTGSTDRSRELAASLGARVLPFTWTGRFADARNYALEQARGDWALTMDADEALAPGDGPLLRQLAADEAAEAYIFTIVNWVGSRSGEEALLDRRVSLHRRRPEYRYAGALHEQIQERILAARPEARIALAPVRLFHYGYLDAEMQRREKRVRNRSILEAALREAPGDPFLLYALGIEQLALGEADRAREHFSLALKAGGPDAVFRSDLWVKLAASARVLGDQEAELEYLLQATEEFPDFTDLWFSLAGRYREDGRLRAAEACLRLCLALGEAPPRYQSLEGCGTHRAWVELGQVYEALGRRRAARSAYRSGLAACPGHSGLLMRLVRLLAAEPAAGAMAELASQFSLSHAATVEALAAAFRRAGAPFHAALLLKRATAEVEPTPTLYLERAQSCLQTAAALLDPASPRQARMALWLRAEDHSTGISDASPMAAELQAGQR